MKQICLVCILLLAVMAGVIRAESNAGGDLVRSKCSTCHALDRVCAQQTFSRDLWVETVQRMQEHGAGLSDGQERAVIRYLAAGETPGLCSNAGGLDIFDVPFSRRVFLFGHPVFMCLAFVPVLFALLTGARRFTRLLGEKKGSSVFAWKKHVLAGTGGLGMWFLGSLGGAAMTMIFWGGTGITGLHYQVARIMIPMLFLGGGLGLYMDRFKKKRTVLPVVHGINNIILTILGGIQLVTGIVFLGRIMW